jgi:hypothetical protein
MEEAKGELGAKEAEATEWMRAEEQVVRVKKLMMRQITEAKWET